MDGAALLAWAGSWPLAAGLVVALAAFTLAWLLHLPLRDASIVDVLWGPAFVLVAGTYAAVSTGAGEGPGARGWLVLVLIALWALRLGGYLLWRRWGEPEDARYRAMRARRGAAFPWVSLPLVFWLQAGICWVVSWPLYQAIRPPGAGEPGYLTWLAPLGTALFAVGFVFETVADLQLARFKADPALVEATGGVMDRGLWRCSRHPNYFGECVLWWGFVLIALSTGWDAWWTLVSPVVMTVLLLRVSGVTLLESHLEESKPGYAAYVRRTNAFVPGRPRG